MKYERKYYNERHSSTKSSAKKIVPIVDNLIKPKSVVDIGCGTGTWLKVFQDVGDVNRVIGVDGPWVDKDLLLIDDDDFVTQNLEYGLDLEQKFDLAMSLEVAEHLPKTSSEKFVETLTRHAPVILFSAAIPFQGGTHHVNEQWPEYWIDKFNEHDYSVLDPIRKKIWSNKDIRVHYVQNSLLFVENDYLSDNKKLLKEQKDTNTSQINLVHPRQHISSNDPNKMSLKQQIPLFLTLVKQAITKRIGDILG